MAQFVLEILDGDRAGEVVPLGERAIRIGRKPGNDLVIPDEKASGVHAEIAPEGGRFVLRDLGSTNGTLLDGRKINEVVLSGGDTFQVGRVRLRVRSEGEPAAGEEGLSVGRLDTSRLAAPRATRSVFLLGALLLAAVAAGGYVFFRRSGGGGLGATGPAAGPQQPLHVPGNRLGDDVAGAESEDGWDLRRAGAGFRASARAHTGSGAFETAGGGSEGGFAVAATKAPLTVLPGRSLTVAAHLRTDGGARAAVRLLFSGAADGNPFQFRSGAALQDCGGWTRVAATVAVPPLAERCVVEVVATWPAGGGAAFDDVAVTEGGAAQVLERKIEDAAATAVGNSEAVAIRSMDPEQATLLGLAPGAPPAELAGLDDAGLLALSDAGARVRVETDARSCTLALEGAEAMQLLFPAESAGGLLIDAGGGEPGFAGVDADSTFTAAKVLLGDRATRCLVELPQPMRLQGRLGGGRYRLSVPGAQCRLVLGFRDERNQAAELLRTAQQETRPGAALDTLRDLLRKVPHDVEIQTQASSLRAELQGRLAAELQQIAGDLDEAEFFDTRGGFERAATRLEELRQRYGERNLPDPEAVAALQRRATSRLQAIDRQRADERRQRLLAMASAFESAEQKDLAQLVRDYVQRCLPSADGEPKDDQGKDGNGNAGGDGHGGASGGGKE